VRQVYEYYATYQLDLLALRVEYWRAHPDTYDASYVQGHIDNVIHILDEEARLLKPRSAGTISPSME